MEKPLTDYTLDEAREVLSALLSVAPDGLRAPLSRADAATVFAAGVEIKSGELGLIDFPTVINGVEAYWCWQSGEDSLGWWHPRDAGFAGRQRITGEDNPGLDLH